MKRIRVYLSGGMQYAAREGADWRREHAAWTKSVLGHSVFDPVIESGRLMRRLREEGLRLSGLRRSGGDWPLFFRRVVKKDVEMVRSSDYVVCLWNTAARKGAGTQGELTIAREAGIPVFLVSRTKMSDLPGWIQGCVTHHFRNLTELRSFLTLHYSRI